MAAERLHARLCTGPTESAGSAGRSGRVPYSSPRRPRTRRHSLITPAAPDGVATPSAATGTPRNCPSRSAVPAAAAVPVGTAAAAATAATAALTVASATAVHGVGKDDLVDRGCRPVRDHRRQSRSTNASARPASPPCPRHGLTFELTDRWEGRIGNNSIMRTSRSIKGRPQILRDFKIMSSH